MWLALRVALLLVLLSITLAWVPRLSRWVALRWIALSRMALVSGIWLSRIALAWLWISWVGLLIARIRISLWVTRGWLGIARIRWIHLRVSLPWLRIAWTCLWISGVPGLRWRVAHSGHPRHGHRITKRLRGRVGESNIVHILLTLEWNEKIEHNFVINQNNMPVDYQLNVVQLNNLPHETHLTFL